MMEEFIIDETRLLANLAKFKEYVLEREDGNGLIAFRDSASYMWKQEGYKSKIVESARLALKAETWTEDMIGTGKIAECARNAIKKSGNLVNNNQQMDFRNHLNKDEPTFKPEGERVLFNIYKNMNISLEQAFADSVSIFGGKYETIAFLFYMKDDSEFLPLSSGHFEKAFELLGINHRMRYSCSWDNYNSYLNIIKTIQSVMEHVLPIKGEIRLIDAHSFVWTIQEEEFIDWIPNEEQSVRIERDLESIDDEAISKAVSKKLQTSIRYSRSKEVVRATKKRANGICEMCHQPAPFKDKKGEPYLEVHHVIWLSKGGEDSTDNTVALCPNCHRKVHVLGE